MTERIDVDSATDSHDIGKKSFFRKLRDGDYGLAKTYWGWGVGIGFLFGILISVLSHIPILGLLFSIFMIFYQITLWIGIWRASYRYHGPKIWAVLARVAVILGWIWMFGSCAVILNSVSGY